MSVGKRRAPATRSPRRPRRGLVVVAELDPPAAEALQWEVRRLVERYGLDAANVRVTSVRREVPASS